MQTDIRIFIFELLSIFLFCLCAYHALQSSRLKSSNRWQFAELISASLFGMLLEWVDTHYFNAYHYGSFTFTFHSVPVCIGLMWGVIIYTSMLTSDHLNLPLFARPFADALQALNIDLGMDIIAIRAGMWHWDMIAPAQQWSTEWFGVPYTNFYGWLLVVFLFSTTIRIARLFRTNQKTNLIKLILLMLTATLLSEIMLYFLLKLSIINKEIILSLIFLFVFIVTLSTFLRSKLRNKKPMVSTIVPASIHLFFLSLLMTNLYEKNIMIVAVCFLMFCSRFLLDIHIHKQGTQNELFFGTEK